MMTCWCDDEQYASMMFIILCIQLAMGAYLNQLDPAAITERWHRAAPASTLHHPTAWHRMASTYPVPILTRGDVLVMW